MSNLGLAVRQVKYTNRAFWRNPASAFFTFAFPLMFLVIFTAIFSGTTATAFGEISTSNYYIPAIGTFSIITATYTNLAISLTFLRDAGILKRIRGTPLPGWAYMFGRIVHAILLSILLVAIVIVVRRDLLRRHGAGRAPAFRSGTLIVGAASFSALGLAVTTIVPNADAAPAVVNATVLPLLFLSGVFIALPAGNPWYVSWRSSSPFTTSPTRCSPRTSANRCTCRRGRSGDLLVMAAWGVFGVIVAATAFPVGSQALIRRAVWAPGGS